jgi:Flp pilus assembly protein TadD
MRRLFSILVLAALLAAPFGSAHALSLFHKRAHAAKPAEITDAALAEIQHAIDEQRYVDAGKMIDQAYLAGITDPRLLVLSGELNLAKGRYEDALASFKRGDAGAAHAKSLQGQGIALSLLNRSDEALSILEAAVALDPSAWRAWNALGSEYDRRRDFTRAESAYDHAMSGSNGAPSVINNRGFSRLLQGRLDDAVTDFVAALAKKPDMTAARTNLRLALAMKGEYDRALAGGAATDEAARLNNAGFAAMLRGDYGRAEELLTQAMKLRGEYYSRASANLDMTRALAARDKAGASAAH